MAGAERRLRKEKELMPEDFLQVTVGKFIFRVKPGYLYTESGVWAVLE